MSVRQIPQSAVKNLTDDLNYIREASSASRNVGDIFYTSRIDSELNGAVEANGNIYNCVDFEGEHSVVNLLKSGKLPYISMEEYEDRLRKDPKNFTIINSSIRENGVYVGNFGGYLIPDTNIPLGSYSTWEFKTRYRYLAFGGTERYTLFGSNESTDFKNPLLSVTTGGVTQLHFGSTGTNWNLGSPAAMGLTMVSGTWYDLKLGFNGSSYYFSWKYPDQSEEEWTTSWTLNNATKVYSTGNIVIGNMRLAAAWGAAYWNGGFISLPDTHFYADGEYIWKGNRCKENTKSCLYFGWDGNDSETFRVPMAEKQKRILVKKKEPTTNDLSWYNLYSDGWCEQGDFNNNQAVHQFVHLPIPFKDTNYSVITTSEGGTADYIWSGVAARITDPSGFSFSHRYYGRYMACGYAEVPNEAEYQFQNIEIHRAMVQITTGNTDTALATCTKVLSDIAQFKSVLTLSKNSGEIELLDNTIYKGAIEGNVSFKLPAVNNALEQHHQIKAMLYFPEVVIDWGTDVFFFGEAPYMEEGYYSVYWDWDPLQQIWSCGVIKKG